MAQGAVSLGEGGVLVLRFIDNRLTNSGNAAADLYVFEVGFAVEPSIIWLRPSTGNTIAYLQSLVATNLLAPPDPAGFFLAGSIGGSTASVDIDAAFGSPAAATLEFDQVKIVDDCLSVVCDGQFSGADIDSVGAISSAAPHYPGFGEDLFLLTGVNAVPTSGPGSDFRTASPGNIIAIQVASFGGRFVGAPWLLAVEFVPPSGPPMQPVAPGVWVNPLSPAFFVLVNGTVSTPIGPSNVIVPGGNTLGTVVPPGLTGSRLLMQAAAISSLSANAVFTMTDAHEFVFL